MTPWQLWFLCSLGLYAAGLITGYWLRGERRAVLGTLARSEQQRRRRLGLISMARRRESDYGDA